MRLLSIGSPLPHVDIDNYNPLTAPSYFDYDALFVDPAGITRAAAQLLEEGHEFEAQDGRPVVNAPGSATAVSAADQFLRRSEETARLLEAGGVVIVLGRPNAMQPGVRGFEGCDRYGWLPAPAGMAWGPPFLKAADGRTVRIASEVHPAAPMLREFRTGIHYRAIFDDGNPAVARAGRVIATGGAGGPIAMEFSVLGGRVVFLPVLPEEAGNVRSQIAERVVGLARALLGDAAAPEPPYWVRSIPVPGLEQVEAELEEAEADAAEAAGRLAPIRERLDQLAAHRRLLTDDGGSLARAVSSALVLLGFAPFNQAGEPLLVESEGRLAMVECEGSAEMVVEWPYVRLQRRLEERLLLRNDQLKGIVIANGQRTRAPESREQQVSEQLRIACENYRYCLMTGETLFALVQRALGGADVDALGGIQRRIMNANGLLSTGAALGEVQEGKDAGPIF
ncbi:MAG: hypothetical protein HYX56_02015 [Chloroflexi bacterium]|nr:hypothetical protein [Chloroflexota bacterium]